MPVTVYRKQLIITVCLLVVLFAIAISILLAMQTGFIHHIITLPASTSPNLQYRYGP